MSSHSSRKDNFLLAHPQDAAAAIDFWASETQASPNTSDVISKHTRGARRYHLFCALCSLRKGHCVCSFVQQVESRCTACFAEGDACTCPTEEKFIISVCEVCGASPNACTCEYAKFSGHSLCVCITCELPRAKDVAAGAPSCACSVCLDCEKARSGGGGGGDEGMVGPCVCVNGGRFFNSECDTGRGKRFQMLSDTGACVQGQASTLRACIRTAPDSCAPVHADQACTPHSRPRRRSTCP